MAKMPTNIEELRTIYKDETAVTPSLQEPRSKYVSPISWMNYRNFLMESDDDDHLRIPLWNQCLNYEFQIRKDAVRLCMEEGFSLKDALWHTLADKEHRMQHWMLRLTIANARQESSKVHKLEQRLAVLEKQRKRSHSPRRQQNQRALPHPSQLALPSSGPQQGKKGKRQKGGKGKGKGKKQRKRTVANLSFSSVFRSRSPQLPGTV